MVVALFQPRPSRSQNHMAGMGRALIQHRLLRPEQASEIQQRVEEGGTPFVDELLASGAIGARELASFAAEAFGYPLLDLSAVDRAALSAAPPDLRLAAEARVVVLGRRAGRISVAISDPTDLPLLDRIRTAAQAAVDAVVVEHDKLLQLVKHLSARCAGQAGDAGIDGGLRSRVAAVARDRVGAVAEVEAGASRKAEPAAGGESRTEAEACADDPAAARLLERILFDAIAADASGLHLEAFAQACRIRLRINGELKEMAQPSFAMLSALATRIKRLCRMDPAERRAPQEGRARLALAPGRTVEVRVSTLPTLFGEKIAIRICNPFPERLDLDRLGYEPDQKAALLEAIERREGMVLMTGPADSGKTLSLYSCLNLLNDPGVDITTIEEGVEIELAGVHQVDLREQPGLSPASALRALRRQHTDILMVGELQERETAGLALEAAPGGRLVLTTLYARNAPAALSQLVKLGATPPEIASSVHLLTAQRLARRLCCCKQAQEIDRNALRGAGFTDQDLDARWTPFRPVGCVKCEGRGYRGRVGVYEVMPMSDAMRQMVLAGGTAGDIEAQARREGVRDLRRSGLLKVMRGETSIEEVLKRVV
jgi:type IV pilus assembly protein PilB